MNYETLVDWLGVIVGAVVLWFAVRYLGRFLGWIERSEIARQKAEAEAERNNKALAASAAMSAPEGVPAEHIAVIAAAVAACGYRVVHIADQATGHAWASEGRWMHQTSHGVQHRTH
jgi:hypothetical protein